MSKDEKLTDDDLKGFRASPEALRAGYLVEVNGEVRVTQKGLAELRKALKKQGRALQ
ncbi:MAG: hypothetical protein Q8L99_04660 [Polycyclovorans sp.]|nr:hypothetical protein [Polycyclovorans sp.]